MYDRAGVLCTRARLRRAEVAVIVYKYIDMIVIIVYMCKYA